MIDIVSVCPMCLRPGLLVERGEDILGAIVTGEINITRTRDGSRYCCHACGAEFDRPMHIKHSAIRDARVCGERK